MRLSFLGDVSMTFGAAGQERPVILPNRRCEDDAPIPNLFAEGTVAIYARFARAVRVSPHSNA